LREAAIHAQELPKLVAIDAVEAAFGDFLGEGLASLEPVQFLLAPDEVLPGFAASGRALDHGEFLAHVEGEVVFLGGTAALEVFSSFGKNYFKVFALPKVVLLDALVNPGGKDLAHLHEAMQFTGIDSSASPTANDGGEYRDELIYVIVIHVAFLLGQRVG
jgi:hypothetical protein